MSDNLDPLSPEEGVRLYLDAKKDNLAAETLKSQNIGSTPSPNGAKRRKSRT